MLKKKRGKAHVDSRKGAKPRIDPGNKTTKLDQNKTKRSWAKHEIGKG
eukprot:COSAG06_NODE_49253_length_326_cov_1.612335_1_plen_47_part_10